MEKYATEIAADVNDAELLSAARRAALTFQPRPEVTSIDVAGVHLEYTDRDTWEVFDERTPDATLLDELDPASFRSARDLYEYLDGLELPATTAGDVDAPEVA